MSCTLCLDYLKKTTESSIIFENDTCFYVEFPHEVIQGWGMVLPKKHRETVFDMSVTEIKDTFDLVHHARKRMDKNHQPDGYNVGWNCYPVGGQNTPHAHLHIIPRFEDEPYAGRGIRHLFKQKSNQRPLDRLN